MTVPVAAVSFRLDKVRSLSEFHGRLEALSDAAAKTNADFVLFPECFTAPLLSLSRERTAAAQIRDVARRFTEKTLRVLGGLAKRNDQVIVAGTQPVLWRGDLYHVCHVVPPRGEILWQSKVHLTRTEKRAWRMSEGRNLNRFQMRGLSFGVLVCYDAEFPELARMLTEAGAAALFVPYCTEDRAGHLRVRYCGHARAVEDQVYVVLAGTVGGVPGVRQVIRSYGNAAVLCPSDQEMPRDGVVAEGEINQEMVVTARLDLAALRKVRRYGDVTPHIDKQVHVFRKPVKIRRAP